MGALEYGAGPRAAAPEVKDSGGWPVMLHRSTEDQTVAKPEWGTKRICPNCGTRYYDMRKDPPTCPSCGTVFDPEALLRSRRSRPIPVDDTKKVAAKAPDDDAIGIDTEEEERTEEMEDTEVDAEVPDIESEEAEEVSEEDEDVLLEDADELGSDEDMGEVVDIEGDEDR